MSSKLFTTRQGTVLLGVIAAVIAAIALLVYLNHYRNSVNAKNAPIQVLVAKSLIQKGTPGNIVGTTDLYQITSIPKSQVESGEFVDPATLSGKVATRDISPEQQLVGQITAGSHVDVWVAFNGQAANGVSRPIVRELYQNMTVLNASANNGNVTLAATSRQAGTLIFAAQNATIWLVLRPTVGSTDSKPPVISVGNLLGAPTLGIGR